MIKNILLIALILFNPFINPIFAETCPNPSHFSTLKMIKNNELTVDNYTVYPPPNWKFVYDVNTSISNKDGDVPLELAFDGATYKLTHGLICFYHHVKANFRTLLITPVEPGKFTEDDFINWTKENDALICKSKTNELKDCDFKIK